MKTALTAFALILSFSCIADPVVRQRPKMAPLQGKVKMVRSCSYWALTDAQAATIAFDTSHYSVDSFNTDGLKIYTCWILRGVVVNRVGYKYNKGKITGERIYYSDRSERESQSFTYDTSGNLAEEIHYSLKDDGVDIRVKYTYARGRLSKKEWGDDMETTRYFYNDKGQVVKEANKIVTINYSYDRKGRVVSESSADNSSVRKTHYTYDAHSNEILAEVYTGDHLVAERFVSQYIYDTRGNWVRCIEDYPYNLDDNPRPKQVSIREIEYY